MDNTTRSPRASARVISRGPGRKPSAFLYTRKRLSLSLYISLSLILYPCNLPLPDEHPLIHP